jgi:N-methylhydantoinase B
LVTHSKLPEIEYFIEHAEASVVIVDAEQWAILRRGFAPRRSAAFATVSHVILVGQASDPFTLPLADLLRSASSERVEHEPDEQAGILSIINPFLCYDQRYSPGGALRHLRFEPAVGTINCPSFPASVTNSQIGNLIGGALANAVLGKMLLSAPGLRDEVFAVCGDSVFPMSAIGGVDEQGNPFGTGFLDRMAGAIGAFPSRDGVDTGGVHWEPKSIMGNVEQIEQNLPVLYLYRRELPDSGGAGKYRGGNSGAFAVIAHGIDTIYHAPSAAGCAVPTGVGLSGGYPASTNSFRMMRGSSVREQFTRRQMPQSIDDVGGSEEVIQPKERGMVQGRDDVWEVSWSAGGGFGDPLERDPDRVRDDVVHGRVSAASAASIYFVVFDGEGSEITVDAAGTEKAREQERRSRLLRATTWAQMEGDADAR